MANKEMTRAKALAVAIESLEEGNLWVPTDETAEKMSEIIGVLKKMHEQLTKPRKKSDTPSKARIVNEGLANKCVAAMEGHDKVTNKWLLEHVSGWPTATPQKATAVMKIAVDDGRVIRVKEGKNVYYSLAE